MDISASGLQIVIAAPATAVAWQFSKFAFGWAWEIVRARGNGGTRPQIVVSEGGRVQYDHQMQALINDNAKSMSEAVVLAKTQLEVAKSILESLREHAAETHDWILMHGGRVTG